MFPGINTIGYLAYYDGQYLKDDALSSIIYNLDYRRSTDEKVFNILFTENYSYIMYKDLFNSYNTEDTEYPENHYGDLFM
jgi:hypothetical protein